MGLYSSHKNEIITLQLISQILGKTKLEYAAQEPQWAHVILDITSQGFSTGLLKYNDIHFEIETNWLQDLITIKTEQAEVSIQPENGTSTSRYDRGIMNRAASLNLPLTTHMRRYEMETKSNFESGHGPAHDD